MPATARRLAALTVLAALAVPANAAMADPSTRCFDIPPMYMSVPPAPSRPTPGQRLCVPWPLPV